MDGVTVACPTCGTSNPGGQKFCGECATPLPLVCPACGTPVTVAQKFCGNCATPLNPETVGGAPPRTASGIASLPAVSSAGVAPPDISHQQPSSASALPIEERRLLTVLFCDLVGFTPLSEQLDPEEVRDIQAAYFSAMSTQVQRYGGIVEKYAGDAVLALFGAPVAHEDDAERGVLCALGMQHAIHPVAREVRRRYGVEVAIRVGVNTGEGVSGSWEASSHQQAAVTGDAINVAARLQAAAEPGVVLVGVETMRLARRRVRFGERQDLSVKGKAEPVPAYAALGLREQVGERWDTEEQAGYATPLIGRDRELALLLAAWTRVQAGEGQLLSVMGEPGVGKSRLVAEGIERVRGGGGGLPRLLRGRCLSYGQSVSLWLIADLLRFLCSIREDAGPETVRERSTAMVEEVLAAHDETDRGIASDVLGEVLGLPPGGSLVAQAGPQIRHSALIRTLGLMLGSLAQSGPVLVVLEDLHWLDVASGEVLEALLSEVPGRRILVLATQRPGWAAPWSGWGWTERLAIRSLPDDDAAALAGAVLGGARLSPQLEQHLRERAEGNPFFVEELLRYLQETGGLERQAGEVQLLPGVAERLPATLTEVLLARLDRLESQVKNVAQVGSVIGRSYAVRLLARVLEREEVTLGGPLRALQQAEIAFPRGGGDPEYVFKHVTLRDVAYSMLVRRRQRQLHLAVARAIAQLYPTDEYVEMIAYHYARTEEDAEAAGWLERAGDRASATYANVAAIAHYRAALDRLERCEADAARRAELEVKLGDLLNRVGRYEEAQDILERAIGRYRAAGTLVKAGHATAILGYVLRNRGELEVGKQRLEEMATVLDRHADILDMKSASDNAHVHTTLANVYQGLGLYREMLNAAERVGELSRLTGERGILGRGEERRGAALLFSGRMLEGRQALEHAALLLEEAGDLRWLQVANANLGESQRLAGSQDEAFRLNDRGLDLTVRTGAVRDEMFQHYNLTQVLLVTGEWERAYDHLRRAEEIEQALDPDAYLAGIAPLFLGTLALRQGKWTEAREHLVRSAELARGVNREVLEEAQAAMGELALLEGKPEEARDCLTELAGEQRAKLMLILPVLAWAQLELGEAERALELAEHALRDAREGQSLLYLPEALRIKGMALVRLGRIQEARAILHEARERAAAMPSPYTEARIMVELALLDRHQVKGDAGRSNLEEALVIFRRLGANMDVERVEEALSHGM